jgi:hypothetical protein
LLLLRLLQTRVLLGAVLIYPALLPVIAPFGVNRSEWGPILVLMMVRQKLLWMLRSELNVLGRHLRRVLIVLLKKRVEIRLVFFV